LANHKISQVKNRKFLKMLLLTVAVLYREKDLLNGMFSSRIHQQGEFRIMKPCMIVVDTVRASPRVCQNLLGESCVLPTSKKLCKVKKKEFISNSLS
jgi:hypothetical protein